MARQQSNPSIAVAQRNFGGQMIANPHAIGTVFALGLLTLATASISTPALAGCNSGNVAATNLLSSANCEASATGSDATAVGNLANANANSETSIGTQAGAQASSGLSVGAGPN